MADPLLDMHVSAWSWIQVALGTRDQSRAQGARPPPGSLAGTVIRAIKERDEARQMLAECYRLSGADPDGDSWHHLWQTAVDEVRQTMEEHRTEHEALRQEVSRLRARVAELEEKYRNHNVTAILTADGNNRLQRGGR